MAITAKAAGGVNARTCQVCGHLLRMAPEERQRRKRERDARYREANGEQRRAYARDYYVRVTKKKRSASGSGK